MIFSDAQVARFMAHVSPEALTGCWLWDAVTVNGYGQCMIGGQYFKAHTAAWLIAGGQAPCAGRMLCHTCDVRSCVNPRYLYLGDAKTNRADALSRRRWAHPFAAREACGNGHKYQATGFRVARDGSRVCRECMRLHMIAYRRRNQR